jgi:hypothetical protein
MNVSFEHMSKKSKKSLQHLKMTQLWETSSNVQIYLNQLNLLKMDEIKILNEKKN